MAKVRGLDVYVEVNTGTYGSPVWTKVGGQKDATLTLSLEPMDVTDKDSAGWKEGLAGNRSVGVEFDAFLIEDDAGFLEMKKGYWERKSLHLQLVTPTKTLTGHFYMTEMGKEAPLDEAVSVAFTLESNGAIVEA